MGDSNDITTDAAKISLLGSQTTTVGDLPAVQPADCSKSSTDVILTMDSTGKNVFIPPDLCENGKTASVVVVPLPSPGNSALQSIDGAIISFRDVGYQVMTRVRTGGCSCRKEPRHILQSVSGVFRPGVNAILGPTGSGKTTLLDILAGRKDAAGCSGDILVDDHRQPRNFKCMSGYVIQDDIVMGMLTVRENIEFSAALRLPNSMSAAQRRDRVNELISDLGLTNCANTKVGTEFVRGVSGGERKRTNIAMELITSPRVLFLDEPTTGLDASTAQSVMYLLQRLSRRGMTVILSIHQPRYSIFKLFDTLMLLSAGECVFHGPAAEALDFFASGNYVCEEHNNPPDFFLDVLNGNVRPTTTNNEQDFNAKQNGLCVEEKSECQGLIPVEEEAETLKDRQQTLVSQYQESKWHQQMINELQPLMNVLDKTETKTVSQSPVVSYPTSAAKQMAVVSSRTWHNMIRNRHALLTQMFSALVLGLIVGSIYFQVDNSCKSGIQNRVGAFFFVVMNYVFGNMAAVDMFIKERSLFIHETVSGYYRISAYFFAKLFCDVLPQRVLPITLFAVITYFMIGFQTDFWHFAFYYLNIVLTSLSGTAVALVFSASTRQHTIGTILTALVWVCMMVFSGLLVNVSTVPHFLQWIKWFSIFRYSMNAFMVNELKGLTFHDTENGTEICDTGDAYLTHQDIAHEYAWDLWSNELALFLLALAFLILTYIQLRRTRTAK